VTQTMTAIVLLRFKCNAYYHNVS